MTEDQKVPVSGTLHHVEIWVPDLTRTIADWAWLLEDLGYTLHQNWEHGRSWKLGPTYLVFEQSPALTTTRHDRCAPGLNHLAFHIETAERINLLTTKAQENGWTLLFTDRHPHAGGTHQHSAYLESRDGFEIELVSADTA
ncbi:VOC family protein [Streptomyces sp. NBC_00424]|uniref:VOC family protein n=1 Tax=Streptomyces sp. NBC_00424 TaxID=2903648 RepID=UPI0022597E20|nr:VOC family protein [Streptomyces sp. NBC_00424]MCX5078496.1 VOC family protein [Streptomyces sp. NBC_00424]